MFEAATKLFLCFLFCVAADFFEVSLAQTARPVHTLKVAKMVVQVLQKGERALCIFERARSCVQCTGCLAHKGQSLPLGPPQGPTHSPTAGF